MRSLPRGAPDCMEAMCPMAQGQDKAGSSNWLSWQQPWVRGGGTLGSKSLRSAPSPSGAHKHAHSSSGLCSETKRKRRRKNLSESLFLPVTLSLHVTSSSSWAQPLIRDDTEGGLRQALFHISSPTSPLATEPVPELERDGRWALLLINRMTRGL